MTLLDRLTDRVEGFLDDVFIPDDLRRMLERASRLIERSNYEQALDLLERAETVHADHHRTYHLLGLCHFFRQEFDEAQSNLERAIELREEPATYLYAGLAAEQRGEAAEAKLHFQKALASVENPPFEFDLYFGLGRALLAMGRTVKALHELRKARELSPDDPEVTVALARAMFENGKIDDADELLAEVGNDRLETDGIALQARIAEQRGADERAARLFERVLEDRPEDVEAMLGAARTHLASGAPARAQQYLLQVVDRTDTPARRIEARTLLGRGARKAGDPDRALDQYRLALEEADTTDTRGEFVDEARLGAGRLLLEAGELAEATVQLDRLVAEASGPIADQARLGLARCRLTAGNPSEARRLLDELDLVGGDAHFRARIRHVAGLASLETGDAAEALVAFQDALHLADKPGLRERVEHDRDRALETLQPDWDLPSSLDDPIAVEQLLDQTADFIQRSPHLEEFAPAVHQLKETMTSPLSVAVVGEFNVGKSTLVNALVEEKVVPMGVLPTTAHTCFIRYGPRKTARVVYREGAREEGQPREVEVNYEEARRRMKEETDQIEHLEFLYPHPQLRSIHFWDTPGFNALEEGHDAIAQQALEEAEAILWVFDAKQTLTQTELERLESIAESDERLVVLLNKADELDDAQVDELRTYLDDKLAGLAAGNFAVSARDALERALRDDEPDGEAPFDAFRSFLDRHITQRAGRIKTLEVRRRLADLVDEIRASVDQLLDGYDRMAETLDEMADWIAAETAEETDRDGSERPTPSERAEREARSVADQFDFALTAVTREIREDLRPRGTFFATKVLDEADRSFALSLFKQRLDDILDRSRRRVVEETGRLEEELTARVGEVLEQLSVLNTRTLNRRLEGLYDELRTQRLVLAERVYGQLRARIHGRVDAAGPGLLEEVKFDDSEQGTSLKQQLGTLLPDAETHVDDRLTDWYREFFLAAERFSDRVQRDLQLLRLEAEYRYDTTALRDLLSS
ncbi:MAG: tetratricopeptide repeat protein [Bradymonadaceae bacterium]